MTAVSRRPRILAVCPTTWERRAITSAKLRERYEFLECGTELFSLGTLSALRFDVRRYLDGLVRQHRGSGLSGILGTGDYPGCMFSAYLAEALDLPAPHPRAPVLLSHKYHSRELQQQIVPEATPRFEVLDPRSARGPRTLPYPFFIKPAKGTMSIRAQMIHDHEQLRRGMRLSLRERFDTWVLLRPYAQLLRRYIGDPVSPWTFVAESPLYGDQVTVDGFVQDGRVTVMGIVDSIMYPGTMSFRRFEYPSSLPSEVQARMIDVVTRLMARAGFDHSCFNIELFYDAPRDAISIIEINPRMSYQFSDLFERVDGMSSFALQLALATGERVEWPRGRGPARAAASFVMRRFTDARVVSVPQPSQIAEVERRFPGTQVQLLCEAGSRLSNYDQDVGSYRYCIVNMASASRDQLHADYAEAEALLPFQLEPVAAQTA